MPKKRLFLWPVVTVVIAACILLIALPQGWKSWAPSFLRAPSLHLGLDLVGGTQLDFRISEDEISAQVLQLTQEIADAQSKKAPADQIARLQSEKLSIEQQHQNLVEAIRTVLERRINALGVSEATITPSYVGNEKHLLVECPGVVDTQQCINVVGKTIQLEFKEEFTQPTADFKKSVQAKADATLSNITHNGSSLQKEGENLGSQLGVSYQASHAFFQDQLPATLKDLWGKSPSSQIFERQGTVPSSQQDSSGKVTTQNIPGIFLVQVLSTPTATGRVINQAPLAFSILAKTEPHTSYAEHSSVPLDKKVPLEITGTLQGMTAGQLKSASTTDGSSHILFLSKLDKGQEEVDVSHILVAYKGADNADSSVARTKAEALTKAKQLKAQIDAGANFDTVAKKETDGKDSRASGGRLGLITRGTMPAAFDATAFSEKPNTVSDPVETPFGYHLIRVNGPITSAPDSASYDDLTVSGTGASARAAALLTRLQNGDVKSNEQAVSLRFIFFSLQPSGWKDTTLDGKHFRTASVAVDPVTNVPVVQIMFDTEGAQLFQELTKNNVGKRIAIFVGGQLVSAPVVQQEIAGGTAVITGSTNFDEAKKLAQDLNTGAIPAPIHLVGQYTIEATLGAAALRTSLQAALIGTLILMLYMILMYRMLGVMADLALGMYAIMLFALLKLPLLLFMHDYIVLTLAGMAGIILSIGMAVDANVLVFERMKEELRKGKLVKTAVEASFKHAWPAIRDSNVSTLITCCILFIIGSSIVRGFAITLGMGIFLSLFTAVTVTRWLLRHLAATSIADHIQLFVGGISRSENTEFTESDV